MKTTKKEFYSKFAGCLVDRVGGVGSTDFDEYLESLGVNDDSELYDAIINIASKTENEWVNDSREDNQSIVKRGSDEAYYLIFKK